MDKKFILEWINHRLGINSFKDSEAYQAVFIDKLIDLVSEIGPMEFNKRIANYLSSWNADRKNEIKNFYDYVSTMRSQFVKTDVCDISDPFWGIEGLAIPYTHRIILGPKMLGKRMRITKEQFDIVEEALARKVGRIKLPDRTIIPTTSHYIEMVEEIPKRKYF